MGLLKAIDVEFVELQKTDEELESDVESLESDEAFIVGETVVIGGELAEEYMLAAEESEYGESEFVVSEAIVIGGARKSAIAAPEEEEIIEEQTEEVQEFLDEEEEPIIEEEPSNLSLELITEFSQGLRSEDSNQEESDWANENSVMGSIDDKIQFMLSEYKDNILSASSERTSLIAEGERERILSEAVKEMAEDQDADSFQRVVANIDSKIFQITERYQDHAFAEVEARREQMMQDVQTYIENTIEMRKEQIMQEATEFIERMAKEYKERLENDNTLISNANSIIARREEILDEAYNKSLKMIQEAQVEVDKIKEEEFQIQDRINELLNDAENKSERIKAEAQEEAERIISEANMESARIIEEAEKSHQEIVEAATHDGFNVGYQEGREEAIKENAQLLMETTNALNKLQSTFPSAVKQNEDKLIKLSLEIAGAVIQEELQAKPEICQRVLESAIKRVSDLEKVIIKVNPLDLDLVLPKQEFFKALLPDVQEFVITGHYSIARGGCLIETNSGTIDAQITTQLAVVEEVFQKIRSEYDYSEEESGE